jgi:hypothetical protein
VVFSTTNPTKLSLQFSEFSTIFYAFYKFQQKTNTISEQTFKQAPGKIWPFTMWPLAIAGGAGGQVPATPARGLAVKWLGEGLGLT